MSNIFDFENETQEEVSEETCEFCELMDETFDYIFNLAEDRNEVIEHIIDAMTKAKDIGYKEAMGEILSYSVLSIQDMDDCNCEDCEDC